MMVTRTSYHDCSTTHNGPTTRTAKTVGLVTQQRLLLIELFVILYSLLQKPQSNLFSKIVSLW